MNEKGKLMLLSKSLWNYLDIANFIGRSRKTGSQIKEEIHRKYGGVPFSTVLVRRDDVMAYLGIDLENEILALKKLIKEEEE